MTCFASLFTDQRRRTTLLALLVLLLPMGVQAQSPVQSLIDRAEQAGADADLVRTVADRAEANGLDADATATLLKPSVMLAERDLPATPLLNKTLEGLAKRVPSNRMAPVLQQLQSHTQAAGELVSTWQAQEGTQRLLGDASASEADRDRLITTIAEARQQDFPLEQVKQFLNGLPEAFQNRSLSLNDVGAAVSILPDLPGARNNPASSHQLLTTALRAGYDAASLRQLPTAMNQAQRTSAQPAAALAQNATNAIEQGAPADQMLRTLARGDVPGGTSPSAGRNDAPSTVPGQRKPPSPGASRGEGGNPGGGNPGGGNPGGGNPGGGNPGGGNPGGGNPGGGNPGGGNPGGGNPGGGNPGGGNPGGGNPGGGNPGGGNPGGGNPGGGNPGGQLK